MTRTRDKLLTGRGGGDDHTQSKMKHTQSKYEIHMYFQKFYNVYQCINVSMYQCGQEREILNSGR
jgi:hypothetical protein